MTGYSIFHTPCRPCVDLAHYRHAKCSVLYSLAPILCYHTTRGAPDMLDPVFRLLARNFGLDEPSDFLLNLLITQT